MYAHWASKYIGIPYRRGASGPDEYDCWGLFCAVMLELHEITFGEVATGREIQFFSPIDTPFDGCAVRMRDGASVHVGVWVDVSGGRVLHAIEGSGVCLSPIGNLLTYQFGPITYYDPLKRK